MDIESLNATCLWPRPLTCNATTHSGGGTKPSALEESTYSNAV
jgi:hypothetical protein